MTSENTTEARVTQNVIIDCADK